MPNFLTNLSTSEAITELAKYSLENWQQSPEVRCASQRDSSLNSVADSPKISDEDFTQTHCGNPLNMLWGHRNILRKPSVRGCEDVLNMLREPRKSTKGYHNRIEEKLRNSLEGRENFTFFKPLERLCGYSFKPFMWSSRKEGVGWVMFIRENFCTPKI